MIVISQIKGTNHEVAGKRRKVLCSMLSKLMPILAVKIPLGPTNLDLSLPEEMRVIIPGTTHGLPMIKSTKQRVRVPNPVHP